MSGWQLIPQLSHQQGSRFVYPPQIESLPRQPEGCMLRGISRHEIAGVVCSIGLVAAWVSSASAHGPTCTPVPGSAPMIVHGSAPAGGLSMHFGYLHSFYPRPTIIVNRLVPTGGLLLNQL